MSACILFSIGLPHKEAAVACCDEVDPLAKVKENTLIISKLHIRVSLLISCSILTWILTLLAISQ